VIVVLISIHPLPLSALIVAMATVMLVVMVERNQIHHYRYFQLFHLFQEKVLSINKKKLTKFGFISLQVPFQIIRKIMLSALKLSLCFLQSSIQKQTSKQTKEKRKQQNLKILNSIICDILC